MLTMRYHILDTPDHFKEAQKDIDFVLRLMNERFTWTHDTLALTPSTTMSELAPQTDPVAVAHGEVIVAEDRLNATLVVSFLRWASERLPESIVELTDESGLCLPGLIVFAKGHLGIPVPKDAQQLRLVQDLVGGVDALLRALAKAGRGEVFLSGPASDYAERAEVQRLGLHENELRRMSLEELADQLPLPWKTERLEAN